MNDTSVSTETRASRRGAGRRARTRADLLAAARQVFAARGYHDATVSDITEAADVGVGTFYLHFHDKDELLATLLREGLCALGEAIAAAIAPWPPEETIPLIIRTIFHFAHAQRDLFRIALTGDGLYELKFRAQTGLAGYLSNALEAAHAKGLLAEYHPPLLARLITGVISQGIIWWFGHEDISPDAMTEQVLHLLRYGLPSTMLATVDAETDTREGSPPAAS